MTKKKQSIWLNVLSSGIVVALLTFVANKAWDRYQHRDLALKNVALSLRSEDKTLLIFIHNNSDEPLDLISADINIDDPSLAHADILGSYPEVSKIYSVLTTAHNAKVVVVGDQISLDISILQVISPKGFDQFGVRLIGPAGPVDLSGVKLNVTLHDIKGNHYLVKGHG